MRVRDSTPPCILADEIRLEGRHELSCYSPGDIVQACRLVSRHLVPQGDVSTWDDKAMTPRQGIDIEQGYTQVILFDDVCRGRVGGNSAKNTSLVIVLFFVVKHGTLLSMKSQPGK